MVASDRGHGESRDCGGNGRDPSLDVVGQEPLSLRVKEAIDTCH